MKKPNVRKWLCNFLKCKKGYAQTIKDLQVENEAYISAINACYGDLEEKDKQVKEWRHKYNECMKNKPEVDEEFIRRWGAEFVRGFEAPGDNIVQMLTEAGVKIKE